jgi:DNA (cytosine-5)-methyltransferase 1
VRKLPDQLTWNPILQVWEVTDLLEQREPFLATFPKEGIMQDGVLWPHQKSAHRTGGRGSSSLLPTPVAHDGKGTGPSAYNRRTPDLQCIDYYLPTPSLSDTKTPRRGDQLTDTIENNTHTINLADAVEFHHGRDSKHAQWGKYAPAITRWESLTRPAPAPTEPNRNGNPRLAAEFSSWLMGWPDGWVTDPAIDISRSNQLRIVGNGVCPQQAAAALRYLLSVCEVAA